MAILNPKEEQVIAEDEGEVQYQARKPLDDELPKKHNKKSTYSETETLFMQWENGSAPIGEVKCFSRFGKFRYYEKTKKGSIELSRDQYNERRKFDAQNIDRRAERGISEAADTYGSAERNAIRYPDSNRNAGGTGVLSRQAVWETLRHDATESVRGGVRNSSGNDINSPVSQAISSAKTSIMQIPALFKHKAVKFGDVNIDIGGGRFDLATNYLASIGTTNLVFDPFNRPETTNASTLDYLRSGKRADTATCANVLNVIAEEEARKNVILEVAKAIKPDGVAYFMVYEGNGTGIGKETSAGYQNNRKTADYVQEIAQWFDSVQRSGKLITATKPKGSLPKAEWELLNSRLKAEIGRKTNFLDESTKWLYAKENGAEVFALYGVGDGTEPTVLHASRGEKASREALSVEKYLGGLKNDYSGDTVDAVLEILSHQNRETHTGNATDGYGRKAVGNDFVSGKQTEKQSGRLGRGNFGQSLDDSRDVTQNQQRTSPMTDREVLTIAANEISVEGLTDGERSALDIFRRSRLVQ